MKRALRYRLFGIGKMPPELKAAAARPDVLLAAEGVSIKQTVDRLKIPRASVRHGTRLEVGAAVIVPDRLMLSIRSRVILDTDLRHAGSGAQKLTLSAEGAQIMFDVASVVDGGSGSVTVQYRVVLSERVLAQLPAGTCNVSLSDANAALLKGWKGSWAK
jgi:hypothetical protein